jgi:hypothetical protein
MVAHACNPRQRQKEASPDKISVRPYLKNKLKTKGTRGYGSSGRVSKVLNSSSILGMGKHSIALYTTLSLLKKFGM